MHFHLTKQKCWKGLSCKLQHSTVGNRNFEDRKRGELVSRFQVKHRLIKCATLVISKIFLRKCHSLPPVNYGVTWLKGLCSSFFCGFLGPLPPNSPSPPLIQLFREAMARARAQAHEFTDVHSWAASGVICPVKWMLDYSSQQKHLQLLMKRQHEAHEAKKEPPVTLAESSDSPAGGSRLWCWPRAVIAQPVYRPSGANEVHVQQSSLSKKTCPVCVKATAINLLDLAHVATQSQREQTT